MTHLKVCELLDKSPLGNFKKIHIFLNEMWKNMELITDEHKGRIIFEKDGEWFFELDCVNGHLLCNYTKTWYLFEEELYLKNDDIEDFIQNMMGDYLKCKMGLPLRMLS